MRLPSTGSRNRSSASAILASEASRSLTDMGRGSLFRGSILPDPQPRRRRKGAPVLLSEESLKDLHATLSDSARQRAMRSSQRIN